MKGKEVAKSKVNKSEAIREYYLANQTASAKEVVAALGKKNIKVSAALVANVKSKAGLTKSRRGRKPGSTVKRVARNGSYDSTQVNFDALLDAKKLLVKTGSASAAIAAIKAVERLEAVS